MIDREVVYERNLTGSYMKIAAAGCAKFDEQILFKRKVKGLLGVEKCFLNGNAWYWYHISGKQSLDTYCRIQNIGTAFIEKILISICDEIEILEWNLFDLDCLVLDPEYIFINNINQEIIFTVYPGHHEEVSSQLQQLMEYLLTKIDHSDAEAVKVAYGIYEKTLDEAYGIMDIRDVILVERNKKIQEKENTGFAGIPETSADDPQKFLSENKKTKDDAEKAGFFKKPDDFGKKAAFSRKKPDNVRDLAKNCIWRIPAEGGTKESLAYLMQLLSSWKEKLLSSFPKQGSKEPPASEMPCKKQKMQKSEYQKLDYQKKSPMVVYPEEPYPEVQPVIHPTVCLSDYKEHPKGMLLYEGTEEIENIRLPQSEAKIGKAEAVEIRISKETISQYHAKINYREEEYYLEDLNSTNGTYINEEALAYKECRKLRTNDIVRFADVRFRFI